MNILKNNILTLTIILAIAIIFYFIPFMFGQFISPFIILIGLKMSLQAKSLDKIILVLVSIVFYWYSLQMISLEMDQLDNVIDKEVQIPTSQLTHSITIFVACYVVGFGAIKRRK
jgi:hypothetical protein